MYKDAYRCDGTLHSRIYYNQYGTRYMSRSFNEQGDLFSVCNYNGNVFHGRVRMYSQLKDIKADPNRGIEEKIFRNKCVQETWYCVGVECTKEQFNELTEGNT